MNLLSKFDSVAVTSDGKISEHDKTVCAAHQAAYDAAKSAMEELECVWTDILAQQEKALQNAGDFSTSYISSPHLNLSQDAIARHIQSLHGTFVSNLVTYFNQTYHVSVSVSDIKSALLPTEPGRYSGNMEEMERYVGQMRALSLRSEQIVEQILARLDGRSLQEQAVHELKVECHRAVWNTYSGKAQFVCRKDVLTLTYGCHFESWMGSGHWELTDGTKKLLRGLAHYETGSFTAIPMSIMPLFGYYRLESGCVKFPDCKKVAQLRLFKNSRMDIRFTSAGAAKEFVENYLGTVC